VRLIQYWRRWRGFDRIEVLNVALAEQIRELTAAQGQRLDAEAELERERIRRIGAEAIAGEKSARIDELQEEIKFLREEYRNIVSERLKSLDALNIRLTEPLKEGPPPDPATFKRPVDELAALGGRAVQQMRALHHQMDYAILGTLHPKFGDLAQKKPVLQEPEGVLMNASTGANAGASG
jgi:hypothetical protein